MRTSLTMLMLILIIMFISDINADVNFNELFTFQLEDYFVRDYWLEDYDNDGDDELLVQYRDSNNVQVYELTGELIDTYNTNPDIFFFSNNNVNYQIDWINEYDPVNYEASLKIYFREEQSQIILDSLSILCEPTGCFGISEFSVNDVKLISNNQSEIFILSGNYYWLDEYGYDYADRNANHIYVLSLENELLQLIDTLENYGHSLLLYDDQSELISHGYNELTSNYGSGSYTELTIYFGKYNIETQTLTENFQYSGSKGSDYGNSWSSHFPIFLMLLNNNDFYEYGAIYFFKVVSTNNEILDQVVRINHSLTDTIWVQEDLFLQSDGWISTGARLGNVLGEDKLILFGKTFGSHLSFLEIVDLNDGYSIYNQQIDFNPSYINKILKDSSGKFYFVTRQSLVGKLYDIDESSFVRIAESTIPNIKSQISNYPNPFNPSTTIEFTIQNDSKVELTIYNLKGQKINTLAHNVFDKGDHSIIWNGVDESGKSVSSGLYFYKLNVNGKTESVKKCLLLK